eukprot:5289792-Alexandrium_andersonii.AAC.1
MCAMVGAAMNAHAYYYSITSSHLGWRVFRRHPGHSARWLPLRGGWPLRTRQRRRRRLWAGSPRRRRRALARPRPRPRPRLLQPRRRRRALA